MLFRWVLLPSDVPSIAYIDGLIRLAPGQTGTFRLRDEIASPFAINLQGWNSSHGDYRRERTPDRSRIAIVGDSFVEALQVAVTASLAEQLERRLGADSAEVYRFGISGAPLSHYLYMLERGGRCLTRRTWLSWFWSTTISTSRSDSSPANTPRAS